MTSAVLYARVSSKEQEQEGYSIPAQQELLRHYAKKNGFSIAQEFTDIETAKKAGRENFGNMIKFLKGNANIKTVLVEKTDRLYRNFKDYLIIEEVPDVEIHLVKENEVISKKSSSHTKFIHGIKLLMAKNYIDNLAEETTKGMKQKLAHGGWTHKAPFGYSNIRTNGKATIAPNDDAKIVKDIFKLATEGYSTNAIRKEIQAKYHKDYKNIHRTLTNAFYIGTMTAWGETFEGEYETFISPAEFIKAQAGLKQRDKRTSLIEREFRFSGILTHDCGLRMYGELKKEKYITYGCSAHIHKKECSFFPKYLSETKILEQLTPYIERISITPETKEKIDEIIRSMFEQMDKESKTLSQDALNKANRIKDKITRLYDNYDDRLLTKEEYLLQKERLHKQLALAQSEIDAGLIVPLNIREVYRLLYEPVVNLHKYWLDIESIDQFRKMIQLLITNLSIKDGKLDITWSALGELLLNRPINSDGRGLVISDEQVFFK